MFGFHHLRARMRVGEGLEPFPARSLWTRVLDVLMYAVGIGAPLALVPQIADIYRAKSATGVSLATWLLLTLFNILWALYGATHKDRQLFFANALMTVFDLAVVAGVLMY